MTVLGVVEIGGTKTLVGVVEVLEDLTDHQTIPTTDPGETLGRVVDHLRDASVSAVGIASFGPLELRQGHRWQGHITRTPKEGWSFTPIVERLESELGVPVGLDTDVNGAALGEGEWGAARGLDSHAYLTVGTGIGGGLVINGSPVHGAPHPEVGHVIVKRHEDDDYQGSCPFHGDCLEGMASGPSLEARFGIRAEDLSEDQGRAAVDLVSHYLAQGVRNLVYVAAPERVVIGGGVSKLDGLHTAVRARLRESLAGYPGVEAHESNDFVTPPGLEGLSGLAGALMIARGQSDR